MIRPGYDTFFRSFEAVFLVATILSSLLLTALLAGVPALIARA
jgi:hypothetical protein